MRTLILLLSFSLAAFAQEATPAPAVTNHATEAQVRQLYQVLHIEDRMQQMVKIMSAQIETMADEAVAKSGKPMTSKDREFLNSLKSEEMQKLTGPDFMNQMLEAMIPAYENHISSEDLQQAIAFYSSPSGQRMLAAQPAMMQEGMTAAMPLLQGRIQEIMKDEQTRIAAYHQKNGTGPAPAKSPS